MVFYQDQKEGFSLGKATGPFLAGPNTITLYTRRKESNKIQALPTPHNRRNIDQERENEEIASIWQKIGCFGDILVKNKAFVCLFG